MFSLVVEDQRECLFYRKLSSLATSVQCPSGGGRAVMFKVSGAAIRYRADGTAPTTANGIPVSIGESVWYVGDLTKLQFIEQTASAVIDLHVFK